jgi:hypothetical protein
LLIEENGTPSQNKLVWKWSKGQATSFSDFGNLGGSGGKSLHAEVTVDARWTPSPTALPVG